MSHGSRFCPELPSGHIGCWETEHTHADRGPFRSGLKPLADPFIEVSWHHGFADGDLGHWAVYSIDGWRLYDESVLKRQLTPSEIEIYRKWQRIQNAI